MTFMPPNDPNRNNNNNNNNNTTRLAMKDIPEGNPNARHRGPRLNENGQVEVFNFGEEHSAIVVLFLMGVASYLLSEACIC